jgi:hypothetical protein
MELLAEFQWTEFGDLSVVAAGPVVLDDLEHDASVNPRTRVMRHVAELATNHVGTPLYLYGTRYMQDGHTGKLARFRVGIDGRVARLLTADNSAHSARSGFGIPLASTRFAQRSVPDTSQ